MLLHTLARLPCSLSPSYAELTTAWGAYWHEAYASARRKACAACDGPCWRPDKYAGTWEITDLTTPAGSTAFRPRLCHQLRR